MDPMLKGLRVLVVEDESMVTMLIEDMLARLGCAVAGVAARLDEALHMVSSLGIDAAVLDLNLDGVRTYPVAEALAQKGIPFVVATGYGASGLPEPLRGSPVLSKPFRRQDLADALTAALARMARSSGTLDGRPDQGTAR